MKKLISFFSGKKTYIGFVALGVCAVLNVAGIIDGKIAESAYAIIGTFTGVSIRQAIAKAQDGIKTVETTIEDKA